MQIVQFNEINLGNVEWELPEHLADKLDGLSPEGQQAILDLLENFLQAHIGLLLAAVQMHGSAVKAFSLIESTNRSVSKSIVDIARNMQ